MKRSLENVYYKKALISTIWHRDLTPFSYELKSPCVDSGVTVPSSEGSERGLRALPQGLYYLTPLPVAVSKADPLRMECLALVTLHRQKSQG